MTRKPRYWTVIPAAGKGQRFGGNTPKQYLPLAGKTIIQWALQPFMAHPAIAGIVVVLAEDDTHWAGLGVHSDKPLWTVSGGAQRARSVFNALKFLRDKAKPGDWVLVHDAARPCLPTDDLNRLMSEMPEKATAGILAAPLTDTLKQADSGGRIVATLERDNLWRALTPQMCRYGVLYQALEASLRDGRTVTDEASAMEQAGIEVRLVEGQAANLKVTRQADLTLAENILRP